MRRRRLLTGLALAALIVLAGCAGGPAGGGEEDVTDSTDSATTVKVADAIYDAGTFRIIDRDAGVVCYQVESNSDGSTAIDCLPIEWTRFGGDDA